MILRELDKILFTRQPKAVVMLMVVSVALLCFNLAAPQLWTQEGRWGLICWQMLVDHNFWQPKLAGVAYYDKPLLSYWLMLATSQLTGFNQWALRLPVALAGLLTLFSTYRIASKLDKPETGMLAAWLLLTTYYFVFWSRVASADVLNIAGIMFALSCYFSHRDKTDFKYYLLFFLTLALTSLCKGLVAVVCVVLALLPDLFQRGIKQHLNLKFLLAAIIGLVFYLLPFLGSHFFGHSHYAESGLILVFRENILRYLQPFDHTGHWYSYFLYLPVYTLPWTPLMLFALWRHVKTKDKAASASWALSALLLLFLFFSFSGSRRSYYVLPMVPFAVLFTAFSLSAYQEKIKSLRRIVLSMVVLLAFYFIGARPWWDSNNNLPAFAKTVQVQAEKIKPWRDWSIVSAKGLPRTLYYLRPHAITALKPTVLIKSHGKRFENQLIVTRFEYYSQLPTAFLTHFTIVKEKLPRQNFFQHSAHDNELSVALIPKSKKK